MTPDFIQAAIDLYNASQPVAEAEAPALLARLQVAGYILVNADMLAEALADEEWANLSAGAQRIYREHADKLLTALQDKAVSRG